MMELDDSVLLKEYVEHGAEDAFATLVARHVNKVYSIALRHTRNAHQAEEITQAVFVLLARKSRQLGKRVILSGWLCRTARLSAVTFVRSESRRTQREQEAHMQNMLNESESEVWAQIAPLLDAAMAGLSEADHDAVALRFFDGKSMKEIGAVLGASEDAAKMRVNRAVEKLRIFFTKRGIVCSAAALTAAISANSVQAAPIGLAVTISTAAAHAGIALTTTATATATKALAMTATQKVLIAATLFAAVGTGIYEAREASILRTEVRALRQQAPLPEPPQQLTGDRDDAARQLAALRAENERLNRNSAELLKLRGEITALRNRAPELTQEKATEIEKENKALRDKTNQLWQSLVGYINQYSNSIALDKRWAYSLEERKRFSLAQAEDGRYLLRRKGSDATDTAFRGGEFTSIGIGPNHIFVRQPAYKNDPEGWAIVDLRSGAVNGVYGDSEFMSRQEVLGIRFMKPEEAWEFMK